MVGVYLHDVDHSSAHPEFKSLKIFPQNDVALQKMVFLDWNPRTVYLLLEHVIFE